MNISEPFVRRPVMTVVLTCSAILFGVLAYFTLPVNDLPAVDYPVIQVAVGYPGATPETMANNVATPLERQFMQIPGLEMVTSNSGTGRASFVLQFALSKSLDAAATDVQAAINQATGRLPVDLPSPPVFTKTNPNDFFHTKDAYFDSAGFYHVDGFGKYRFGGTLQDKLDGKTLYIWNTLPKDATLIDTIKLLNGNPVLYIFT